MQDDIVKYVSVYQYVPLFFESKMMICPYLGYLDLDLAMVLPLLTRLHSRLRLLTVIVFIGPAWPWGHGLQAAQKRRTFPCGHPLQLVQTLRSCPCSPGDLQMFTGSHENSMMYNSFIARKVHYDKE